METQSIGFLSRLTKLLLIGSQLEEALVRNEKAADRLDAAVREVLKR